MRRRVRAYWMAAGAEVMHAVHMAEDGHPWRVLITACVAALCVYWAVQAEQEPRP